MKSIAVEVRSKKYHIFNLVRAEHVRVSFYHLTKPVVIVAITLSLSIMISEDLHSLSRHSLDERCLVATTSGREWSLSAPLQRQVMCVDPFVIWTIRLRI